MLYTDQAGNADLSQMDLLFNSSLSARGACWAFYVRSSNTIFLVNEAGNGFASGSVTPGVGGSATNSQCTISSGGAISTTAITLSLPIAIAFKSSFIGTKQVYGFAAGADGQVSGVTLMGKWTP